MAWRLSNPAIHPSHSCPQLLYLLSPTVIQNACQGGLLVKTAAPPGLSQHQVRTNVGVDVAHRATSGQDAHPQIEQSSLRMFDMAWLFKRQARENRGQKVLFPHPKTQRHEWGQQGHIIQGCQQDPRLGSHGVHSSCAHCSESSYEEIVHLIWL
jgi:hypothetical protein